MIEPIKHNDISDGQKKSMKSRTITAIILAVVCVPCLFIGSWAFFVLAAFMTGASAFEIMKAGNYHTYKYKYFILVFGFIVMYSLVFWIFIKNNLAVYNANPNDFHFSLENGFNTVWVSTIAVVVCAIVLFFNCLLDDYYTILDVCYHIAMFVFVSIAIQSFMFLRYN